MREIGIGILVILVVMGLGLFGKGVTVYNTHINLKTQIEAKQKDNEQVFDNMWKKISQTAQVADKYKDGLKEVLTAYVDGRAKGDSNLLMDWTKEAVPSFDSNIYMQINNVVVASRDDFVKNQRMLLDLSRQHNQFIQTFPNNIFCMILNIKEIEIRVVTSTKTEQAFETQKEDDIKI